MQASNRISTEFDINTGVARLKISDTNLNDTGVYTVVAENKAGSDRTRGRLDVEKESGIDNKPIISPNAFAYLNKPEQVTSPREKGMGNAFVKVVVPLSNIHSMEGKPARLACRIEGNPKPTVISSHHSIFFLKISYYIY